MGRPAKHSADDFVDAAITLFAERGVRAVTLAAVADAAGAANGSVYHRFPDRPALLAAVWQRTSARFETGYREVLGDPSVDSAVEAAVWVVDWCRANLLEAQVLAAGPRTFAPSGPAGDRHAPADTRIRQEIAGNVRAVAVHTAAASDEIAFVMYELPLAVVRRHLQAGKAPGHQDSELVRSLAGLVLRR